MGLPWQPNAHPNDRLGAPNQGGWSHKAEVPQLRLGVEQRRTRTAFGNRTVSCGSGRSIPWLRGEGLFWKPPIGEGLFCFWLTPPLTTPENFNVFTINQVDAALGMGWGGDGVGSVNVRLHLQTKLMLRWGWGGVGMGWGLLTFACTCKPS